MRHCHMMHVFVSIRQKQINSITKAELNKQYTWNGERDVRNGNYDHKPQ